jgi:hypothetical protein
VVDVAWLDVIGMTTTMACATWLGMAAARITMLALALA